MTESGGVAKGVFSDLKARKEQVMPYNLVNGHLDEPTQRLRPPEFKEDSDGTEKEEETKAKAKTPSRGVLDPDFDVADVQKEKPIRRTKAGKKT